MVTWYVVMTLPCRVSDMVCASSGRAADPESTVLS